MKHLLLSTAMLVSTTGFAAAEVTLSGDARMGIIGGDNADTTFTSRARVSFGLSGATDGGLEFGASFRADNAAGAAAGDAGSVYISGAFGKLSMGDVDSADNIGQLSGVGLTGLGDANEVEYSADGVGLFGFVNYADGAPIGGNPPITLSVEAANSKLLYTYSSDDLSISASVSQNGDVRSYAAGATYVAGDLTVGAGYGVSDVHLHDDATNNAFNGFFGHVKDMTLMAAYSMGATTVKGVYQHKDLVGTIDLNDYVYDRSGDAESFGLSVDHAIDALTLTGFVKTSQVSDALAVGLSDDGISGAWDKRTFGAGTVRMTSYGIGASYDLGGGATLVGGVAHLDSIEWSADPRDVEADLVENTVFDLGVKFTF